MIFRSSDDILPVTPQSPILTETQEREEESTEVNDIVEQRYCIKTNNNSNSALRNGWYQPF